MRWRPPGCERWVRVGRLGFVPQLIAGGRSLSKRFGSIGLGLARGSSCCVCLLPSNLEQVEHVFVLDLEQHDARLHRFQL